MISDERKKDNQTKAIDEQIKIVKLHNLEEKNNYKENTILKI